MSLLLFPTTTHRFVPTLQRSLISSSFSFRSFSQKAQPRALLPFLSTFSSSTTTKSSTSSFFPFTQRSFGVTTKKNEIDLFKPIPNSWKQKNDIQGIVTTRGFHTGINLKEESKDKKNSTPPQEPTGVQAKIKGLFKKYGYVAIGTYATVYASTFLSFLGLLYLGLDFEALAAKVGLEGYVGAAGGGGILLAAFIMTKLCSPLRLLITLSITPYVASVVRKFRPLR
mgnify:CR=1 FL=1